MKRECVLAAAAAIVVLTGCARGPLHTASPMFRQLRVGDKWTFKAIPNLNRGTLLFEVTNASAPNAQGGRSLTLHIRERYWGGLPGYQKGWQEDDCDLPVLQAANGSLAFTDLKPEGRGAIDLELLQFPPMLSCPLAAGQTGDTGEVALARGSERTTWKVVGQEEIGTAMGRFRAWRVDCESVSQGENGKHYLKLQWTDWYDSEHWLLRRRSKVADSGDSVLNAIKVLAERSIEQVP